MNLSNHLPSNTTRKPAVLPWFRWVICALLFFGMTKNYMDRQVLSVLKTSLQQQFAWTEVDYGNIVFAFQAAYALGLFFVGHLIDRLGARLGYAFTIAFWSLASVAHGFMSSTTGFLAARFALGLGESGVFPASLKVVAEWFPKKERALATGIFNAGTNVGAAVTPFLVPVLYLHWGWRGCFFGVGAIGFVGLVLWLWIYRASPELLPPAAENLPPAESAPLLGEPAPHVRWLDLFAHRQTWAFISAKFLIDPIWWFYLFWIPDFLQRRHGLSMGKLGLPILVIYLLADVGSVAGGWLSSFLIQRGKSVNVARKSALLVCAVSVVPIIFASRVASLWSAVLLIGLAAAAHQGFSTNLFTLPSDLFPTNLVGSVVGIGGAAGAIGGMLIAQIVSHILQWTGSYAIPFLLAGSSYLIACAFIQVLAPQLDPAHLDRSATQPERVL